MRKSLILFLSIVGGGVCYAAATTEVGADSAVSDPSTWRWQISSILSDQGDSAVPAVATVGAVDADAFNQRYERFSPLGIPEKLKANAH